MKRLLAGLIVAALALPAYAWGELGHRLVGSLAERDLTPAAREELARLLAGEPDPSLAGISTWADTLRANDPGLGRRSAPWHYVNLGEHGCTYDAKRDCPGGDCVVEAIRTQTKLLADRRQSIDTRRRALRFVVHFVADVHQPLHAAYRRDKGGNSFQVRVPTRSGERGSNLHAWWDSGMLALAGLDEAAHLARLLALPGPAPSRAKAGDAAAWARQSCAIAVSPGFYPRRGRLPAGYAGAWSPVADAQLRRAGSRLAQVLNSAVGR